MDKSSAEQAAIERRQRRCEAFRSAIVTAQGRTAAAEHAKAVAAEEVCELEEMTKMENKRCKDAHTLRMTAESKAKMGWSMVMSTTAKLASASSTSFPLSAIPGAVNERLKSVGIKLQHLREENARFAEDERTCRDSIARLRDSCGHNDIAIAEMKDATRDLLEATSKLEHKLRVDTEAEAIATSRVEEAQKALALARDDLQEVNDTIKHLSEQTRTTSRSSDAMRSELFRLTGRTVRPFTLQTTSSPTTTPPSTSIPSIGAKRHRQS